MHSAGVPLQPPALSRRLFREPCQSDYQLRSHALRRGAPLRSLASGIAVYDTLFVELAARRSCRLATFDKGVLNAFPDIAIRPRDLLRQ